MLNGSYEIAGRETQLQLIQRVEPLLILIELTKRELNVVNNDLCCLTAGPNLILEYAVTQQRKICLEDLIAFLIARVEENQTGE